MVTGLTPNTLYYCQAYALTTSGVLLKGQTKSFTTPNYISWTVETSLVGSIEAKYAYLFGSNQRFYTINDPPLGYKTYAEASLHMVTIKVPVWAGSGTHKRSSTSTLIVNRKLSESVKAIFAEIYALDMKFPIIFLHGFDYRTIRGPGLYTSRVMSHHSFGAAIDINLPYNLFYHLRDGRNPKSPYYVPQQVIDIFAKYGWSWGGNFAEGLDTMHFQYLGLDLLPQTLLIIRSFKDCFIY